MGFEQKPSRASGLVSGFSPCLIYLIYLSLTPFKSSGLKQGLRNQEQTELKPTEYKDSKVLRRGGWRDSFVRKVHSATTRGPEFNPKHSHKKEKPRSDAVSLSS